MFSLTRPLHVTHLQPSARPAGAAAALLTTSSSVPAASSFPYISIFIMFIIIFKVTSLARIHAPRGRDCTLTLFKWQHKC